MPRAHDRPLVLALVLLAGAADAQNVNEETRDRFANAADTVAHTTEKTPERGKPSFVFLPIPLSDPAIGTGLILVGAALYNPNESARAWITGVGALGTSNGSHAFAAAQQAQLWHDKVRLVGVAGKADLNLKFYGIGADAGARQISVPTDNDGRFVLVQGLYGVTEHLYLGLRFQDLRIKTMMDLQELGSALGLTLSTLDLDHRTTSLGPALDYDTRDNQFQPGEGDYATLRIGYASPRLGSDVSYRSLHGGWAHYWSARPGLVVAGRISVCAVDGHVPFTELCMYGTGNDLRGYTGGQYRDRTLYAAQAEARWRLAPRWGAVFFAGTGAVAPAFGDLWSARQLPAAGAGIRWLASAQYKVNVSIDVAAGRDGHAVYFSLGEAF